MKKFIAITLLLVANSLYAQNIKVKKGEIFLDKEKIGSLEKVKVKKASNYYIIKDNAGTPVLYASMTSIESKLFGSKKISNYYYFENRATQDTIAVDDSWFFLGDKKIAKYLAEHNLLNKEGLNKPALEKLVAASDTKPKYVREKIKVDQVSIDRLGHIEPRGINAPITLGKKAVMTKPSKINGITVQQTKYEITQDKVLIGYAYLEAQPITAKLKLVITNTKYAQIGLFDGFSYYTTYPLTEMKIPLKDRVALDVPPKAIVFFSELLIRKGLL